MAERSPKHSLTRSGRGWYKRVAKQFRWICSIREAPTGDDADAVFEKRFADLCAPPVPLARVTVEELCTQWLARHIERVDAGTLGHRTLGDYTDACRRFIESAGGRTAVSSLGPQQFTDFTRMIECRSPGRRAKLVMAIRALFRWAAASRFCPLPEFGPDFRGPRKAEFRRHRAAQGVRLYSVEEIGKLLGAAEPWMRAAVLLGLNGGFGNTDIATLPWNADWDLDRGFIKFARGKTGIERCVPLWTETVSALLALRTKRRAFQDRRADSGNDRVFRDQRGNPLISDTGTSHKDALAVEFSELCVKAGVVNRGFYTLRRTFRTHADDHGDQRAAAAIMGHETGDIGGVYVQRITLERLRAVTDHVRAVFLPALTRAAEPKDQPYGQ